MNTTKEFLIAGGPSKDRILDNFKYSYDSCAVVPLTFTIRIAADGFVSTPGYYTTMEITDVIITSISYQDFGSGSLRIKGFCSVDLWPLEDQDTSVLHQFEATYDAMRRNGSISIKSET